MITLAEIHAYPVKSCRGIPLEESRLTASGLAWDRHWMFVDASGKFLSQRTHPQLARIETLLARDALELRAPGAGAVSVPFEREGERVTVQVWNDRMEAFEVSGTRAWAREAVGGDVRLVGAGHMTLRAANREYAGATPAPLAFSDGYPLLVCNHASLEELNRRMPQPIPMERFRPNLVLQGVEAFAEDHIDAFMIGEARLRLVKPCTRCIITSTDQRSGERSSDPLPVLRQFRFDRSLKGVKFGENAVIEAGVGALVRRGMRCSV